MLHHVLLGVAVLTCVGCSRQPIPMPVPPQRVALPVAAMPVIEAEAQPQQPPAHSFVNMSDADAAWHIVKDISDLEGNAWRWAYREPTLRLEALPTARQSLRIELSTPGVLLKKVGPVKIDVLVNGRLLAQARYSQEGQHVFEKPVPAAWLAPGGEATVTLRLGKTMSVEDGRRQLGVILTSAGFVGS